MPQLAKSISQLPPFVLQWYQYSRMPGAEKLRVADGYPCLWDRTKATPFDSHYFYVNAWAMRHVAASAPGYHVDLGSQLTFPSLLAAVVPVIYVDVRPLHAQVSGLWSIAGDATALPFRTSSIESLSTLHVVEHIGLGRYGDRLNPRGTRLAATELERVLAIGGTLLFAIPVGRPRVCFNAHRVHEPTEVPGLFPALELREFSAVTDEGEFRAQSRPSEMRGQEYACGMYEFVKSKPAN